MPKVKPVWVESYRVKHPVHGSELVSLVNPPKRDVNALAVQEAARRWGVRWGKVFEQCTVTKETESWKCTCDTCKKEFFSTNVASVCVPCVSRRNRAMLQYMKRHPVDRRINAGN
jgi:hypothetical protein